MENEPQLEPLKDGQIWLIYQDCALCGSRKEWGDKQLELANTHGLEIVKVGFTKPGASKIIRAIVEGEIKRASKNAMAVMPYFCDGKKFSQYLEDFVDIAKEDADRGIEKDQKEKVQKAQTAKKSRRQRTKKAS